MRYENLKTGHPQPSRPWEWCQIDTVSVSNDPPLRAIIIIDEYSRWVELKSITGAPTARDVRELLDLWYARYQPHDGFALRADRGTEFRNATIAEWVETHGGRLHYSTTRRPTACGLVERVNGTLLGIMRIAKQMYPAEGPVQWLRRAVGEYWNRPHSALDGRTPNEMLLWVRPNCDDSGG
jgi:transposase InsO family protein